MITEEPESTQCFSENIRSGGKEGALMEKKKVRLSPSDRYALSHSLVQHIRVRERAHVEPVRKLFAAPKFHARHVSRWHTWPPIRRAPSIIAEQRAPERTRKSMWRKGDAKMGPTLDPRPVIETVQKTARERTGARGTGVGTKRGHNKYRVRTRSGATYAVSDNDGVCSGCLLSEQISE